MMDFVVDGRDPDLFVYTRARRHFKLDWAYLNAWLQSDQQGTQ